MNQLVNCLALDCSNRWLLAGIYTRAHGIFSQTSIAPRSAFQLLPRMIQQLCKQAQIKKPSGIVVTIGPGSFTGVRLGVSFARNLGQLWQIPLRGISSLHFYAYSSARQNHTQLSPANSCPASIAIMLAAKQQRVYGIQCTYAQLLQNDISVLDTADKSSALSELAGNASTVVDQTPHHFVNALPPHCQLFADDPASILSYIPMELRTSALAQRIQQAQIIPPPHPQDLYELALQHGGLTQTWQELQPYYLRPDPAHARYV